MGLSLYLGDRSCSAVSMFCFLVMCALLLSRIVLCVMVLWLLLESNWAAVIIRRFRTVIERLPVSDNVRSLSLPGTYHEKISSFGDSLKHFSRLKSLDVSRNAVESLSVKPCFRSFPLASFAQYTCKPDSHVHWGLCSSATPRPTISTIAPFYVLGNGCSASE